MPILRMKFGMKLSTTFVSNLIMMLTSIHSLTRWAVLFFGLWTLFNAVRGVVSKKGYDKPDNLSNLFFMISCDIQLLIGIIIYVSNGWFEKLTGGMGPVMKDTYSRFFAVEHAFTMILAWILVHVGRTAVKKASSHKKHKAMLLYFGLALLLILISIPWPFREVIGKALFPSF